MSKAVLSNSASSSNSSPSFYIEYCKIMMEKVWSGCFSHLSSGTHSIFNIFYRIWNRNIEMFVLWLIIDWYNYYEKLIFHVFFRYHDLQHSGPYFRYHYASSNKIIELLQAVSHLTQGKSQVSCLFRIMPVAQ